MNNDIKRKNIIIKLSGEALLDEKNSKIFSKEKLDNIVLMIKNLQKENVNIGLVSGAGNIMRGRVAEECGITYDDGDYMGMVGTVINLKAISSSLSNAGIKNKLYSALEVEDVAPKYNKEEAKKYYDEGYVVLFAGGVGKVRHTTDSCAALRALEMESDMILFGKYGTDGVYDKDPNKYKDAKFLKELTYQEALDKNLQVMDKVALEMLKDSNVEVHVFSGDDDSNFIRVIKNENIGSVIKRRIS